MSSSVRSMESGRLGQPSLALKHMASNPASRCSPMQEESHPTGQSNPRPESGTLPWTRSCFVCGQDNPHGLRLRSRVEGDRVALDYTTREADLGYRHLVHGGITMTLLDEVMTWAAIIASQRACVAAELTVRLRKPIVVGQRLRVEGWVTAAKGRLLTAEGVVCHETRQVLASASGKHMPMSPDQFRLCAKDFVISPDSIHPDRLMPP